MRAQGTAVPLGRDARGPCARALSALRAALGRIRTPRALLPEVRTLRRDDCLRVVPGRLVGAIACRGGTCLVTQEGDPVDHVLVAGGVFRPAARGLVVAWALAEAEVALVPLRACPPGT